MLNQGKTTKYLKYAIGEIILVVIGILIALSINNWNENRKQENSKQKLMLAIKNELLANKESLESYESGLHKSIEKFNKVLCFSAGTNPSLPTDSLKLYLSEVIYPVTLSIINSVQEEAVSSGKFELLGDSLKQSLSILKDYTNSRNSVIEQRENLYNNDSANKIEKLLASLSTNPVVPNKYKLHAPVPMHPKFILNDTDLVTLVKDPETYITLKRIYQSNIENEIWVNFGLIKTTHKTIDLINKELNEK
jgi:hypothetical protein